MTPSERDEKAAIAYVSSKICVYGDGRSMFLAGISHERARQAEYVKALEKIESFTRNSYGYLKQFNCADNCNGDYDHEPECCINMSIGNALAELDKLRKWE